MNPQKGPDEKSKLSFLSDRPFYVLPARGDKLFLGDKEVGYITSAVASPKFKTNIALAYIRREANEPGTELVLQTPAGKLSARISPVPF